MRPPNLWVLVADGSRARILRNVLKLAVYEDPSEDLTFGAEHRSARDIMSDKPGRSFASVGARRSAMEYHSDPVREEERSFALSLATRLEKHHQSRDFDMLAIVAPPRMLGYLRQSSSEQLHEITIAEIAKDLSKLSDPALRSAVAEMELDRRTRGQMLALPRR